MDGTENRGGFFNNHREEGTAKVMGIQPRKNTATDRKTSEGGKTVVETNRKIGRSQGTNTEVSGAMEGSTEGIHENGKVKTQGEKHEGEGDKISKGNLDETKEREDIDMGMAWVTEAQEDCDVLARLEINATKKASDAEAQVDWAKDNTGPLAMCFEANVG